MIPYEKIDISKIKYEFKKNNKGEIYCNDIFTFDIETSTAYFIEGKWRKFFYTLPKEKYKDIPKTAWCYVWQFSINDVVVYGRTLLDFYDFFESLLEIMNGAKMIVYVHNLSFEFHWLRNIFEWEKVFARKKLRPMYALYKNSEWRCSYFLSNMSLANIGKYYTSAKKQQSIDYTVLRFSDSILDHDILLYSEYDCVVLYEYIKIMKNMYGNCIWKIPITQTGTVRRDYETLFKGDKKYINKCRELTPNLNEFLMLKECMQGGLTRANAEWTGLFVKDVESYDIISSYPYVMLSEKFPCSHFELFYAKGELFAKNEIFSQLKKLFNFDDECALLHFKLYNVKSKNPTKIISFSKCTATYNTVCDNGRIARCDWLEMSCTEIDLILIYQFYNFETIELDEVWVAKKKRMDERFIDLLCDYIHKKNTLKGDDENKVLYQRTKEKVNSLYGMMCTNYIAPDVSFSDTWDVEDWSDKETRIASVKNKLAERRRKKNNIYVYSQGVYVTAYARRWLCLSIMATGDDNIYNDTDSNKHIGNHSVFFDNYNLFVENRLKKLLSKENFEKIKYKNMCVGQFEHEATYDSFITFGAKKYAYEKGGDVHVTVSGLSKEKALSEMKNVYDFKDGKTFSYKASGRVTMEYDENNTMREIKGHKLYANRFCIIAQPTTYTLNINKDYKAYLDEYMTVENATEYENIEILSNRKDFWKNGTNKKEEIL